MKMNTTWMAGATLSAVAAAISVGWLYDGAGDGNVRGRRRQLRRLTLGQRQLAGAGACARRGERNLEIDIHGDELVMR